MEPLTTEKKKKGKMTGQFAEASRHRPRKHRADVLETTFADLLSTSSTVGEISETEKSDVRNRLFFLRKGCLYYHVTQSLDERQSVSGLPRFRQTVPLPFFGFLKRNDNFISRPRGRFTWLLEIIIKVLFFALVFATSFVRNDTPVVVVRVHHSSDYLSSFVHY